jgi:uncharacterized protein YndB with AHSA1/START domain
MTDSFLAPINPELDLVLERIIDVSPELVWEAWTRPEHLKEWFTPRPWTVSEVEIDVRPGGKFRTVMRSPEGVDMDGGAGCFIEVVPQRRLVWTDALEPGFRPAPPPTADSLRLTAVISIEPHARGARYVAMALHSNAVDRQRHEDMGFHSGWGTALDQLVAHMKGQRMPRN